MTTVSVEEIKQDFPIWLQKVEAGEKVVILKSNRPMAEIIPCKYDKIGLRPIGLCKEDCVVYDDFEAPLPEEMYAAYEEMAADKKREAEALEWAEGTFGDVADSSFKGLMTNSKNL
jgi:antitoxin (DNA-binding transcriptional repressor) of toxin-antitoxin stability system